MTDDLLVNQTGPVLQVTFNRPLQRNAMTWEMYDGVVQACDRADGEDSVRVLLLRGAGDEAFVAGTDIGQFRDFRGGDDGVVYERRIGSVLERLESVRVPSVAAISGYCIGGGLSLAAACDIRIASATARFGVPVARTLGNCLSVRTLALLTQHLGPARTLNLLLQARLMDAEEAAAAGFVTVCDPAELDDTVAATTSRLTSNAPLTMWAAKEMVRRLRYSGIPDADDVVRTVYGSEDFRTGVQSFLAKRRPQWRGR